MCVKLTLAGQLGDDPYHLRQRFIGKLVYRSLLKADAVICVSQELYTICNKNGIPSDKLSKIPNGVDTDLFKPMQDREKLILRKQLGLPEKELIVCFTGKAGRRKGIDIVLKAIANALDIHPNIFLCIVGPKDTKDTDFILYLNNIIDSFGLSGRIRFTGLLEFHEAKRYMQASDIFFLPSSSEGLPNALLEAMACGLCCVVPDKPPMNLLVQNRYRGFVINPENMDEFKHIIELFINHTSEINHFGVNARRYIEGNYSITQSANTYLQLYRAINS